MTLTIRCKLCKRPLLTVERQSGVCITCVNLDAKGTDGDEEE